MLHQSIIRGHFSNAPSTHSLVGSGGVKDFYLRGCNQRNLGTDTRWRSRAKLRQGSVGRISRESEAVYTYWLQKRSHSKLWNWHSDYWSVGFYPNMTTLRSGLCCRNSVCRLSVCLSVCRLSVVCLSSVTLVHRMLYGWSFRQYFFTAVYACHPLTSVQILGRSSDGNPSAGSVKRKRVIKIERFWTYRRLYLLNGTR